jgi:hypothetical protein
MEVILISGLVYAACWACSTILSGRRQRRIATNAQDRIDSGIRARMQQQHAATLARDRLLRESNRQMQTALLQLEQAPDFYRAASFAAHAAEIPLAFRQQQFNRFRPRMLAQVVAQLRNGVDGGTLRDSLEKLVTHLGMASFEADYIWQEAQRQLERRESPQATYAEAMTTKQQEHEQRMSVLQTLVGIDDELREQLVEAEEQRFRDEMLTQNDQPVQHHEEF